MTETPTRLLILAIASASSDPQDAEAGNSLVVVDYPVEPEPRIYWRGERIPGARLNGPAGFSVTHPDIPLIFDNGDTARVYGGNTGTMVFRDEELTFHMAGFKVDYDAGRDTLVF